MGGTIAMMLKVLLRLAHYSALSTGSLVQSLVWSHA